MQHPDLCGMALMGKDFHLSLDVQCGVPGGCRGERLLWWFLWNSVSDKTIWKSF